VQALEGLRWRSDSSIDTLVPCHSPLILVGRKSLPLPSLHLTLRIWGRLPNTPLILFCLPPQWAEFKTRLVICFPASIRYWTYDAGSHTLSEVTAVMSDSCTVNTNTSFGGYMHSPLTSAASSRSPGFCWMLRLLALSVVLRRNVPPSSKVSK